MEEGVVIDPETFELAQKFIKWVDEIIRIDEEEYGSLEPPRYAQSKHAASNLATNTIVYAPKSGVQGSSDIINQKEIDLYSLERIDLLNRAQQLITFQDALQPHIANTIQKCKKIESIIAKESLNNSKGIRSRVRSPTSPSNSSHIGLSRLQRSNKGGQGPSKLAISRDQVHEEVKLKGLWSERAVEIDAIIKTYLLHRNLKDAWNNERMLFDFDLLSCLTEQKILGMVDTFYVSFSDEYDRSISSEARNVKIYQQMTNMTFSTSKLSSPRFSLSRIYSDFSYFGGNFALKKESCDNMDIDDYIHEIVSKRSAIEFNSQSWELDGTLKALTPRGDVYIRPLCTVGDVLLALHELLDPRVFQCGCVQLPSLLSAHLSRDLSGYIRFVFQANEPLKWYFCR